jgi:Flp pilus assembly protein TadB
VSDCFSVSSAAVASPSLSRVKDESEQRRRSLINEKQNLLHRSDSMGDMDVEKMMERRRQAQIEAEVGALFLVLFVVCFVCFVCLFCLFCLFVCLFVLFVCVVCLFVLFVCLCCLFVCLFVLFVCLFVCLCCLL